MNQEQLKQQIIDKLNPILPGLAIELKKNSLEESPIPVVQGRTIREGEQIIEFVNESFTRLLGYTSQELIGSSTNELMPEGDDTEAIKRKEIFLKAKANGGVVYAESEKRIVKGGVLKLLPPLVLVLLDDGVSSAGIFSSSTYPIDAF